jgi:hypothetical protein
MRPRQIHLSLLVLLTAALAARADFRAAGPLVLPRTGHLAVLLDHTHILFAGGASFDDRTAEIYDTRSGVSRLVAGTMLSNHYGGAAVRLADGRVLITGGGYAGITGLRPGDGNYGLAACEIFDPVTERFTTTGALSERRMLHTATRLPDGRVLIAGGETLLAAPRHVDLSYTATCELFDPATGTWHMAAPMVAARTSHTAVLLADGRVLFAGGSVSNVEIYDPVVGTSIALASTAGFGASAALLRDGRVVIGTGGSYELIDPAAATVTPLPGPPTVPGQTATPLSDGSVLFAGGSGPSSRFDPVRAAIVVGPWLLTARTGHTATPLPDGSVLIAGGGTLPTPLASVELFVLSPAPSRTRSVRK